MHLSAMLNCKHFFDTYGKYFPNHDEVHVVEIGSQDVNGSLRTVTPDTFKYTGVDFVEGKGVDVILDDPYHLPFESNSADIIVSSSCFEHSEMFWLVYLEIMRVLKPKGLFYLNVPSNGNFHRYPVDCWRFYPDSGNALVTWGRRNNIHSVLLESYISNQMNTDQWNDYVAVFLKDESYSAHFTDRIIHHNPNFRNGVSHGSQEVANFSEKSEDHAKLSIISQIALSTISIK
jgi:SAM-dependent methyltransferase